MSRANRDWDIGISVLSVYDADGFLGVQYDSEGSSLSGLSSGAGATPSAPQGGVADYEVIMPGGFLHRPSDPATDANGNPDGSKATQLLNFREGGRVWSMPLGDPRVVAILPTVEKGDTIMYGDNGSHVRIVASGDNAGRITQYTTTTGAIGGQSVYSATWPDQFLRIAPFFQEKADSTGYHVAAGGCRIDMMSIGGIPGASAFGAGIAFTAPGNVALDAPHVLLGATGELGKGPVVRADLFLAQVLVPMVSALQAIEDALIVLSAAPAIVGSPPAGAAAAIPAVATAIASLTALESGVLNPSMTWASSTTSTS